MPKRKLSPQMWIVVAAAGYVFAMLIGYVFLLRPLFKEVDTVQEESAVAEEYLVLQNTASQLASFKRRIVTRNYTREVRASLDSLATDAGVKLVDVKRDTSKVQLSGEFLLKTYRLTLEGNYAPIARFIRLLEQPNNYYAVTNLTVIRLDEQTGRARAQLKLKMLTIPEETLPRPTPADSAQTALAPQDG